MSDDHRLTIADFDESFGGEPTASVRPEDDIARGRATLSRTRRRHRTMMLVPSGAVVALAAIVIGTNAVPDAVQPVAPTMSATPTSPSSATPPPGQDDTFLLPPDSPQRIDYAGVTSDPVVGDQSSEVSEAEATRLAKATDPPVSTNDQPVTALRLISSKFQVGFPTTPTKYWVIVWFTRGGIRSGGFVPSPTPGQPTEDWIDSRCATTVYVNATNSKVQGVYQQCVVR